MRTPVTAFEHALLVKRVATRFATEFDTPEALKKYLHDHPGADKSKHSVKKDNEGGDKTKGDADDGAPPVTAQDVTRAERRHSKAKELMGKFEHAEKALSKTRDYKYHGSGGDREEGRKKAVEQMEKVKADVLKDTEAGFKEMAQAIGRVVAAKSSHADFLMESLREAEKAYQELSKVEKSDPSEPLAGTSLGFAMRDFMKRYKHLADSVQMSGGKDFRGE